MRSRSTDEALFDKIIMFKSPPPAEPRSAELPTPKPQAPVKTIVLGALVNKGFFAFVGVSGVEEWLATLAVQQSPQFSDEQRQNLALIRQRGYHVGLQRRQPHGLAREIEDIAAARSPKALRFELAGMIRDIAHLPLPETVDPAATHEILLIAAPIFDPNGTCVYNLCLGDYPTARNLEQIENDGNRLLRACIEIMQTHTQ